MPESQVTPEAVLEYETLGHEERQTALRLVDRLCAWPDVSGVVALNHSPVAAYRVKSGRVRVLFDVVDGVAVVRAIRTRDHAYRVTGKSRQNRAS